MGLQNSLTFSFFSEAKTIYLAFFHWKDLSIASAKSFYSLTTLALWLLVSVFVVCCATVLLKMNLLLK